MNADSEPDFSPLIFVSYHHSDTPAMELFAQALTHSLGMDPRRLRCFSIPGHNAPIPNRIKETIDSELRTAKWAFVMLSESALASQWVQFEIELARQIQKPTVYILSPGVEHASLPLELQDVAGIETKKESASGFFVDTFAYLAKQLELDFNWDSLAEDRLARMLSTIRGTDRAPYGKETHAAPGSAISITNNGPVMGGQRVIHIEKVERLDLGSQL